MATCMPSPTLSPAIPQLPTGNLDITADFFERALGFEVVARFPSQGHLIVRRGAAEIQFWRTPDEHAAHDIAAQSSCYIRVENIAALHDEFEQRNTPIRYGLVRQPWGMNEMQVDDPYGNAIRFGERIAEPDRS
jgi:catechol 2,3-dioxygenase-like lactoylglutathione lyase family enzyme